MLNQSNLGDVLLMSFLGTLPTALQNNDISAKTRLATVDDAKIVEYFLTPTIGHGTGYKIGESKLWARLFTWKPGLFTILASDPRLEYQFLFYMKDYLNNNPNLVTKISNKLITSLSKNCDLATIRQNFNVNTLKMMNSLAFAQGVLQRGINTLSNDDKLFYSTNLPLINAKINYANELNREITGLSKTAQAQYAKLSKGNFILKYANPAIDTASMHAVAHSAPEWNKVLEWTKFYNDNYEAIKLKPEKFDTLTTLYKHIVSRFGLISQNTYTNDMVTSVNSLLDELQVFSKVLKQVDPPATGTKVKEYIEEIYVPFYNNTGKLVILVDELDDLNRKMNKLLNTVLDKKTGTRFDPKTIDWLMNGIPSIPGSTGNLTYGADTGLRFTDVIKFAMVELLNECAKFSKSCSIGVQQVLENKKAEDKKNTFSFLMNLIGGIASLAAGCGKLISTFTDIAGKAIAGSITAVDLLKGGSEALSLVSASLNFEKNKKLDAWKTTSKNLSGELVHNHLRDPIDDVYDAISSSTFYDSNVATALESYKFEADNLIKVITENSSYSMDTILRADCPITYVNGRQQLHFTVNDFYGKPQGRWIDITEDKRTPNGMWVPMRPLPGYACNRLEWDRDGTNGQARIAVFGLNPKL